MSLVEPIADMLQAAVAMRRSPPLKGICTENVLVTDSAQGLSTVVMRRTKVLAEKAKAENPDALGSIDPADQLVMTPCNGLVLVKNRFNIVDVHLLLCARDFTHQLEPLLLADMEVVQPFLEHGFVAAYNAGTLSGASQPRKHIQLVGVPFVSEPELASVFPLREAICRELADSEKLDVPTGITAFAGRCHGVVRFSAPPTANTLHSWYRRLLAHCGAGELINANRHELGLKFVRPTCCNVKPPSDDSSVQICTQDYSMLITLEFMFIGIRKTCAPFEIGCNSMSYTGNLFVASDADARKVAELGPFTILAAGLAEM